MIGAHAHIWKICVRSRKHICRQPNIVYMWVNTQIHENILKQNQAATIAVRRQQQHQLAERTWAQRPRLIRLYGNRPGSGKSQEVICGATWQKGHGQQFLAYELYFICIFPSICVPFLVDVITFFFSKFSEAQWIRVCVTNYSVCFIIFGASREFWCIQFLFSFEKLAYALGFLTIQIRNMSLSYTYI